MKAKLISLVALSIGLLMTISSQAQFDFDNNTDCDMDIYLDAGAGCVNTCNSGWILAPANSRTTVAALPCGRFNDLTMDLNGTIKTVTLCTPGHAQTKYTGCTTGTSTISEIYISSPTTGDATPL